MAEGMLIRYGDLTLKGKNQKLFVRAVNQQIKEKLDGLEITFDFNHDRVYIFFDASITEEVIKRLKYVTGVFSFSPIYKCTRELEEIKQVSIKIVEEITNEKPTTFKVESKRADKSFEYTSMEFSKELSSRVLSNVKNLKVDVHHPELVLNAEIRRDAIYLFTEQIKGLGGFPIPMGGKALVLLSGGIDSPVATFLSMKKGMNVECVHFESTPLTPLESAQKIVDLGSILARYGLHNQLKIHFVPFTRVHEEIIKNIPEEYNITVMRRMMVRIATKLLFKRKAGALITGDSIGQVASQTLESMSTIQNVTDALVIRPLASYDKLDIIKIAREIETLDISNRPFQDCCSVYTPKNPAIHPNVKRAELYETSFDFAPLIEEAANQTKMLIIHKDEKIDLVSKGFVLSDILDEMA